MAYDTAALDAMFRPRSVAVIGASNDPTRTGGRPLRYLLEAGFRGAVYSVNQRRNIVQGMAAYASVAELPETPDVALIAVPAAATPSAIRDCVAKGVRAAVLFTAGFAETGAAGQLAQDEMVAIARQGGMRLLGPNCLGLYNSESSFFGTFASILDRGFPKPGPIGIVSQSGAFGMYLAYVAQCRGLGIRYAITTGNEADIDLSACLLWMAHRPEVEIILCYAEGVRDGATFLAALRAAHAARKPVIITKVGASTTGARAASSHTASLAGSDAVFDAVLRQYKAVRVATTEEQLDLAYAVTRKTYPANRRLGIITGSGGIGVQMCDVADASGLEISPLPEAAQRRISTLLPYAAATNPVDVTAQALSDMSLLTRSLAITLTEGGYGAVVAAFLGLPLARAFAGPLRDALMEGTRNHKDRLLVLNVNADPDIVRDYEAQGFLVFEDATRAVRAIAGLCRLREGFDQPLDRPAGVAAASQQGVARFLSEYEAKQILLAGGIDFLPEKLAVSTAQAAGIAAEFNVKLAMKIVSPDILHKTEIGGVILNVPDGQAAAAAYEILLARAQAALPQARITGVLIAPMAGEGIETILGVARDPVFGPVVMFGIGGVFVELMKDVTFRLAPFDDSTAHEMIREIKGFPLLQGFRSAPPADINALAAALAALSRFAAANASWIESIDLNPFLVRPAPLGAVALDAAIVTR